MTKFRIEYDDHIEDVVDKISEALKDHGLTIEYDGDSGDGYIDYEIVKNV